MDSIVLIVMCLFLIFFPYFEKSISLKWNKWYYKSGILFFYKEYKVSLSTIIKKKTIINRLRSKFDNINYQIANDYEIFFFVGNFKKLGPQFFEIPLWRGNIIVNNENNKVKVTCFINWYTLFLIIFLFYLIFQLHIVFSLLTLPFFILLYFRFILQMKMLFI
jgi:hypothetical protein